MRRPSGLDRRKMEQDCLVIRTAAEIIHEWCENPLQPSVYDTTDCELPLSVRLEVLAENLWDIIGGEQ